jgi:hypothetical protein
MKPKAEAGAVFSVPLDETRKGYGQIIEKYENVLLYCVFYPDLLDTNRTLVFPKPLLAGITASAKVKNGDWQIIGYDRSNLNAIKRPNYKVMIAGKMHVVDFAGHLRRKIEDEESDILMFRSIVAPIRYQKALCAHFGIIEWEREYDKLLYDNVIRSQNISLR